MGTIWKYNSVSLTSYRYIIDTCPFWDESSHVYYSFVQSSWSALSIGGGLYRRRLTAVSRRTSGGAASGLRSCARSCSCTSSRNLTTPWGSTCSLGWGIVLVFFVLFALVEFTHNLQDSFTGTGAITWLPQCQWSNPEDVYRWIVTQKAFNHVWLRLSLDSHIVFIMFLFHLWMML